MSNFISNKKTNEWKSIYMCIFLMMFCAAAVFAQQGITVTGTVTDEQGETIPGVNVIVRGTTTGVISDVAGRYSVIVPDRDAVIVFSFLGFGTQEVIVGERNIIDVTLREESNIMDDMVVIGYGAVRRRDLTGSVVQIRPDDKSSENPKTIQDLLRGTAGMAVGYSATASGGGSIQIRGQRSVYTAGSHNEPLIILDGMMFFGSMNEISPDDIEQIDVLKDASAASIYGAQAANGVIIITTKKGKIGKPVINVSTNIGFVRRSAYREMWNPQEYMQHREDYYKAATYGMSPEGVYEYYRTGNTMRGYFEHPDNLANWGIDLETWRNTVHAGGIVPAAGESDRSLYARRLGLGGEGLSEIVLANYLADKSFDWWNQTFRTGFNQDYNISASGASDRINYYMSFGYQKNEGAISGNFFDNIRSNMKVDGMITDWLEIGANVNFQKRSDGDIQPNLTTAAPEATSNQLRNSPYSNYLNEDGSLAQFPNGVGARLTGTNFDFEKQWRKLDRGYMVLNTILTAKVKLPFGITYSFNAQPRFQYYHNMEWNSSARPGSTHGGQVDRDHRRRFDWSIDNRLNWEQSFNRHRFNVTLVQEAERRQSWQDQIRARNFQPSDALEYHNTGNSTKDNSSYSTTDTRHSATAMLARLFYSYDHRYMITASLRRDGYSAFGQSNPFAVFPSVALAWTFSEENFFNFEPMNFGKLRVSWGKNGNRSLNDPYISLANLSVSGSRHGYIDSQGNLVNLHLLQIDRMANPYLQWEKSNALNFGFDFGFLRSRITGTIEYYDIATTDMIMTQRLTAFSGFADMVTNLGEVNNKGVEFSISTVNVRNNIVEWRSTFNIAYNKNTIKHLYFEYDDILDGDGNVIGRREQNDTGSGWHIGHPISVIWNHKVTGIWQVDEAETARVDYNQRPGDPKVQKNPDNPIQRNTSNIFTYDNGDRYYLGQTTAPVNWSFRNDITLFRDLTISFNMYSRMGHKSLSGNYLNNDNESNIMTQGANHFKKEYWTTDNPTNKFARLQANGVSGSGSPQKLYNRSFVRLETISASYTLPKAWTSMVDIERLRVFGSIRNVAVWNKEWPYGDPETGGLATRVFSLGLNVTF